MKLADLWPFGKKQQPRKRAFAGSAFDRLVSDWVASGTSQDAEIKSSLLRLRNRARQLGRDNEFVAQLFRTVQNNVVGQGIPFEAQVKMQRGGKLDETTNDLIESKFEEWCRADSCHTGGTLTFQQIERMSARAPYESGELLIRLVRQRMGRSKVPLALELIEADLLDEGYSCKADNGNIIRMGVEVDQWQRPVAYHFLPRHPGDFGVAPLPTSGENGMRRIRVPADEIVHIFDPERPLQTRGYPKVASAMMTLRHLGGYTEAEVIRARASASVMGFIESPNEEMSMKDEVDNGQSVTEFEPGVWKQLRPGEKASVPNMGAPAAQFDPFVRAMLRQVAAGVGASYETLSRDYSQANYTAARLALLEDRDNWRVVQSWLISKLHQRVYEEWLDMAVLAGELQLPLYGSNPSMYRNVRWLPRGWAWVDPLKEVTAYQMAVRSGFRTVGDVVAESGGDIDDLWHSRKSEIDMADELGLVFDTDPAKVNVKGIAQPTDSEVENDAGNSGNKPAAQPGKGK